MQYRFMTKDQVKIFSLGFGCMRFPVRNQDNSDIDVAQTDEMLSFAIEQGVNYLDTAYVYHDEKSEEYLGNFLKKIDRSKVYIATKLPMWLCNEYADYEKYLDIQRMRLGVEQIDFYLLHSLGKDSFEKMKELNVFRFLDEMKKCGKIKYAGFSFHDEYEFFPSIVDSYDWDFCQIQLNYLDIHYQAGLAGLKYCHEKGISVVVMEPLKGGKLASVPSEVEQIFDQLPDKRTPAEWAQRFLYAQEGVSLILSGMSHLDQVRENIQIAKANTSTPLSDQEKEAFRYAKAFFDQRIQINCTTCGYCMPCPTGVNIPGVFTRYNESYVFDCLEDNQKSYRKLIDQEKDASRCVACGQCETLCPQHLEIIEGLEKADAILRS